MPIDALSTGFAEGSFYLETRGTKQSGRISSFETTVKSLLDEINADIGEAIQVSSSRLDDMNHLKEKPSFMPYAGKRIVENTNEYFAMASNGTVSYNGTTFVCDMKANALTLGDVSDKNKCISVGLSKGGSLIFNRDDKQGVMDAITMFSPEDQERIIKAIQIDNMAQKAQKEIEDTKEQIPDASSTTACHVQSR